MTAPAVVVMAKSPRPGKVKTRLCPDLDPFQAARLAEAALADTLEAVAATAARPIVALDGPIGDWLPAGVAVVPQRGRGLDERIAAALMDTGTPALVIGSDTPQVTSAILDGALDLLLRDGVGATLGLALDGGWWALGLKGTDPARAVLGVPMSTAWTGAAQLDRLRLLRLRVALLQMLRDVDLIADAFAVAAQAPASRFAAALADVTSTGTTLEPALRPGR
jgi:glycosyltransferase A (GT-A) superfamily protein (DUF2064 family)